MDGYRHFYQKYLKYAPSESPFSFRKHSTIGVGGEAKIAFYPQTIEELVELLRTLQKDEQKYLVLGCLSNVLPSDGLSDCVVICTKQMSGVNFDDGVFALAGTTTAAFLQACKKNRRSGGEFLFGIPSTIGGAAFMNAGAADRYICEIVRSVLVYQEGNIQDYALEDCQYAYKSSVFMTNGGVILGVRFDLTAASEEEIEERTAFFRERRKHLPKGKSMGCVFKNPNGVFAGKLIEETGLKGRRVGGAYVSDVHANFIINEGGTAQDVKTLIAQIKDAVYQRFGIQLQEEIRYL